ncbi:MULTISPECIES: ATP synthase F1 subunit gamma [Clostridium]|uniref:ATP synthase gamma chain n=1 Tax=Clostridium botulinum (strain Eklund 17B / Type B) TaxID=935198 RepID=ATPG_CLOBB|nr:MULTISPECIES: ATP synthase F1 subunit gamma [Clostridium]B2TJZ9.1 RecName: Full=ATP synthase gamma chain; AltName: Full=ATP synthase F1 sector gamma subunit; AltName: Full=F-ATPase gamma subunit [Clostridium botulinum B str. Eklund 17B (NRP)]MBN1044202.1 ATP synthase subunit gamma [Clostridium botulinum]ACD23525.1 ATP synthase F1, gamma subunit [Clostridium botulinum B str. Eklund 17B (NRP)]MBN1050870.1 ATP synthase subunit gamma [Clostridium botulinum]MBN1054166.1 ATP synthase subunit gamm
MGSAGLIEIKRRIKSVESTRKITNAMGLVATSKLRKTRKELFINKKFFEETEKIIEKLASTISQDDDSIYFKSNKSKYKLYILVSSDTGLCGSYNNTVVSYLDSLVRDEKENIKVITVGSKGLSYVKRIGLDTIADYVDIPDIPTVKEVKIVFESALKMYKDGEVSEINVAYLDFVSPVKQEPKAEKLLPIEKITSVPEEFITEPNSEEVLNNALNIHLKGKFRNILLSAKCSEQSSRMTAMNGATQNANDILDNLNLKYNRIRQQIITQEISEIVGGAEAQK